MADLTRLPGTARLDEVVSRIEADGGVIVEDFLPTTTLKALKGDLLPKIEARSAGKNDFSGFATRRMSALFDKSRRMADVVLHPLFLGAAEHFVNAPVVFGSGDHARSVSPGLRIGVTQLIRIGPGQGAQPLHRDHWSVLWRHPDYGRQVRVQLMVAMSDFTEENGATRVVPGSHTWSDDRVPDPSEAVSAAMPAGSALLIVGSTHHGGGPNRTTDQYRTGLGVAIDSAAVRQEENMYLALRPEVVKSYPEVIQRLLGWSHMPETYSGWVEIDGEMADPIRLLE